MLKIMDHSFYIQIFYCLLLNPKISDYAHILNKLFNQMIDDLFIKIQQKYLHTSFIIIVILIDKR